MKRNPWIRSLGVSSAHLGDCALLIHHDTGMSVMCVIGDRGPADNGWGNYISRYAL